MGTRRIAAAAVLALGLGIWVGGSSGATTTVRQATAGGHDWTRFGWSASRTISPPFATGITAAAERVRSGVWR